MARRLAFWTAVAMGLVLAAGVLVTKTESGQGCGNDFPLCRGSWLPGPTVESWIEYGHRAVSGVAFVLVAATVAAVRRAMPDRREAAAYAWTALGFTLLQAALGALAVVWPQSEAVMALHFGFSLVAFAASALLALETSRGFGGARRERAANVGESVSRGFARLVWAATAYAYAAVYLGAYVRHTDSQGGCTGWPLCNGEWIPELSGATGIAFAHRLAALGMLALAATVAWVGRREDSARIRSAARAVLGWTLAQAASGGVVSAFLGREAPYLAASVVHTLLIGGLFTTLAYLGVAALRRDGEAAADAAAARAVR